MSQNQQGGARVGAGRKSNAELDRARALIDQAVTDQNWVEAWSAMLSIVKTSTDPRAQAMAMRLLCEYRFGKPTTVVEYRIEKEADAPDASAPFTDPEPDPNEFDDPADSLNDIFDLEHMKRHEAELMAQARLQAELTAASTTAAPTPRPARRRTHLTAPRQKMPTRQPQNLLPYAQRSSQPPQTRPHFEYTRVGLAAGASLTKPL